MVQSHLSSVETGSCSQCRKRTKTVWKTVKTGRWPNIYTCPIRHAYFPLWNVLLRCAVMSPILSLASWSGIWVHGAGVWSSVVFIKLWCLWSSGVCGALWCLWSSGACGALCCLWSSMVFVELCVYFVTSRLFPYLWIQSGTRSACQICLTDTQRHKLT